MPKQRGSEEDEAGAAGSAAASGAQSPSSAPTGCTAPRTCRPGSTTATRVPSPSADWSGSSPPRPARRALRLPVSVFVCQPIYPSTICCLYFAFGEADSVEPQRHTSTPKTLTAPGVQLSAGALLLVLSPGVSPAPHAPGCSPSLCHQNAGDFFEQPRGGWLTPSPSRALKTCPNSAASNTQRGSPSSAPSPGSRSRELPSRPAPAPQAPLRAEKGSPREGAAVRWVGTGAAFPAVPGWRAAAAGHPRVARSGPARPTRPGGTRRAAAPRFARRTGQLGNNKTQPVALAFDYREGKRPPESPPASPPAAGLCRSRTGEEHFKNNPTWKNIIRRCVLRAELLVSHLKPPEETINSFSFFLAPFIGKLSGSRVPAAQLPARSRDEASPLWALVSGIGRCSPTRRGAYRL